MQLSAALKGSGSRWPGKVNLAHYSRYSMKHEGAPAHSLDLVTEQTFVIVRK